MLVTERRPPTPPHLPTVNKWQHRQCAQCCETITTGMFGTKAHYCNYLELLFCPSCFGRERRPLPWRLIHELDDSPKRVSKMAADYLDTVWASPCVVPTRHAPDIVASPKHRRFQRFLRMRDQLYQLRPLVAQQAGGERRLMQSLSDEYAYFAANEEFLRLDHYLPAVRGDLNDLVRATLRRMREMCGLGESANASES